MPCTGTVPRALEANIPRPLPLPPGNWIPGVPNTLFSRALRSPRVCRFSSLEVSYNSSRNTSLTISRSATSAPPSAINISTTIRDQHHHHHPRSATSPHTSQASDGVTFLPPRSSKRRPTTPLPASGLRACHTSRSRDRRALRGIPFQRLNALGDSPGTPC